MLDNGLDYIYEAIHPIQPIFFNSPSSRHDIFLSHNDSRHLWKYSILHLYSGIQLLLKEKLKQEHWSLIFQDISSASQEKLSNGNFVSVYHYELIKRLRSIAKVTINDEPINNLRDYRNRFEHFQVDISINDYEKIVAPAFEEIIHFWNNNLKEKVTPDQQRKFDIIKSITTGFEFYRNQKLNNFKNAIRGIIESQAGIIVFCPTCGAKSFAIFKDDEKKCKCFVCEKKYSKDNYLKNIREKEEERKKFSLIPYEPYKTVCPSCNKETRIRYTVSDDISLYYCLSCFKEEEISKMEQVRKQAEHEINEYVEELEKNHTNEEVILILEEKLIKEGYTTREELNRKRRIDIERELERRKLKSNQ